MTSTSTPPHEIDPDEMPPGQPPKDHLSASIVPCVRGEVDPDTNATSIINTFNQAGTQLGLASWADAASLPIPKGQLYLRFLATNDMETEWSLFIRLVKWGGKPMPDSMVGIMAKGRVRLSESNGWMMGVMIEQMGPTALKVGPERTIEAAGDDVFSVRVRYELWTPSAFLVANSVDFLYNISKDADDDHADIPQGPSQ
jgi:hypothetical protein